MSAAEPQQHHVRFREAARFWTRLGFVNFGGPAGQIALMHDEIVDRRKWVSNSRCLHALNCMLLPGPEAQQLAIYLGWLLHRVKGGVVAGVMFVLPSVFVTFGLSWLFAAHGDVGWVSAIFAGLAPAVIAVVAAATIRIGTKALANWLMLAVAVVAFVVAIFVLHVPFPIIVLGAALIGLAGAITRPASSTSLTSWRSRSGSRSVTTGLAPRTRCRRKPGPRASSSSASSSGSCRSQRSPPGAGPKTHSPR